LLLPRFVPTHESDSTAAYGSNDSPSARTADKVIDAGKKDLRESEAFLQHWLQTQQVSACRTMMFKTFIMYQTSRFDIDVDKSGIVSHPRPVTSFLDVIRPLRFDPNQIVSKNSNWIGRAATA
jgi:hypothetical protein